MNHTERKILIKKEVKDIIRIKSDAAFQEMINAGEFPEASVLACDALAGLKMK